MKKININYGQGVTVMPAKALESLGSAKKSDIVVLLHLLSDPSAESSALAEKTQLTEDTIEKAVAFWRGTGILSFEEDKAEAPAVEVTAEKPKKKGKNPGIGDLPDYSTNELVDMIENDREVALMIDECERALGKIFRMGETAKILALRDYLGFSSDYIITLCEYCAKIGKNSVRYLETTAASLYDDGIASREALETHLAAAEAKHELQNKIRSLFGMNMSRALTTKEKKFIESWISFGYGIEVIELAYEITVDKINEPSLNYANAILESWNSKGLKTEEEVRAQIESETESKSEPPAGKSFDSTDFFEAALRRSYSESGTAPEIPKSPKKRK